MKYESTAGISIETINDLIAENCVYEITIQDDKNYPQGNTYDIFVLLSIKRQMEKFLKGCPYKDFRNPNTEKEVFAYIYTKLAYLFYHETNIFLALSKSYLLIQT